MTDHPLYHEGTRRLQDQFDSRRIADRLEQVTVGGEFTAKQRELVERSPMFFLATVSPDGQPDVSYKGGHPGFVRVVDSRTLAWPDYDGNGMFRSLGNALLHPRVSLLFLDFESPRRLRLHGRCPHRRSAAARDAGGPADRALHGRSDLSELPALRSSARAGRALPARPACRAHSTRAGVEGRSELPRSPAAPLARAARRRGGHQRRAATRVGLLCGPFPAPDTVMPRASPQ